MKKVLISILLTALMFSCLGAICEMDPVQMVSVNMASVGEQNALDSAESYLSFMAFSYDGLVGQLEYEGYSHSEAVYAADHCDADWYEQAAKSAEAYLDTMSFSYKELVDQLVFEGFTTAEAEYGADHCGF